MQEELKQTEWYYELDGKPEGPIRKEAIEDLIKNRGLTEKTLVWKKGMKEWISLNEVNEFNILFSIENIPPPIPKENKVKPVEKGKSSWKKILLVGIIVTIVYYWLSDNSSNEEYVAEPNRHTSIGSVINTDYFKIKLNDAYTTRKIDTGNPYSDVIAQQGNKFLVLDITFKNESNESRIFVPGALYITYNGRELQYDHQETILAEGWMTFMDQINPYTSKHTRIVYQIPQKLLGEVYWVPGRNSSKSNFYFTLKE